MFQYQLVWTGFGWQYVPVFAFQPFVVTPVFVAPVVTTSGGVTQPGSGLNVYPGPSILRR